MRGAALLIVVTLVGYPGGLAADDVPTNTGAFLTYCQTNEAGCQHKVVNVYVGMQIYGALNAFCPPRGTGAKEQTAKVLTWLADHPDTQALPTHDGIGAAFKALYPCTK